jgi:RNA polymerase sigma-70 factor (ECF subfamily)
LTVLDGQLLERANSYDTQALAEIYDCYAERIYYYLYRHLGDAAQAEDLTSEVFCKLLQVLHTPRAPRDNLLGWLYRVASNLATDWFRHEARRRIVPLADDLTGADVSPVTIMEGEQSRRRLGRVVSQLTPTQQQVILLRFGEGLKIAEIGRLMGKSEGAIKLLQHRAIKRLGTLLEREGKHVYEETQSRAIGGSPATSRAGPED